MAKYKEAEVVMIASTQQASDNYILKGKQTNFLYFNSFAGETSNTINDGRYIVHHLYFITDDTIREGDWFLGLQNQISQAKEGDIFGGFERKIVVTTNKFLTKDIRMLCKACKGSGGGFSPKCTVCKGSGIRIEHDLLPQPSLEFIEDCINKFNEDNLILKVLIELNEPCCKCDTSEKLLNCCYNVGDIEGTCSAPNPNNDFYGLSVKVNPTNNTVSIKQRKENWDREEMGQILMNCVSELAAQFGHTPTASEMQKWNEATTEWIKENL